MKTFADVVVFYIQEIHISHYFSEVFDEFFQKFTGNVERVYSCYGFCKRGTTDIFSRKIELLVREHGIDHYISSKKINMRTKLVFVVS